MDNSNFQKSDMGAQAAWKGFSSQTFYIAARLISDEQGYEYYPEDIEDLVVKKNGVIVEAVQIKNISAALTLSSLALTKTSACGEGFFNRMCSIHEKNPLFNNIRIAHFGTLGIELQEVENNKEETKKRLSNRLKEKHNLTEEEAVWLINSLKFEKVDIDELKTNIYSQISSYVPAMAAPDLVQDLLIQYISELSNTKGFTTLEIWREKVHKIGINVAALNGFYNEYNKSLVRLSELQMNRSQEQLKEEFFQGVSAHPAHIRLGLDFKRYHWLQKIHEILENVGVALVKGVSGQGKSALCYRYLLETYPEGVVFCVRAIATEGQAQNLVLALDGLGKYNKNLIIYIDVQPGETLWAFLLQELQSRGLKIPVLISIRDEDYNVTPINGKYIKYDVVELVLSEAEAEQIYNTLTKGNPHSIHRTFEEAWQLFGGNGPLIEFAYLITNNQTLTKRLQSQIDSLLQEGILDKWLELLKIVCYAGRLGCSVDYCEIKKTIACDSMQAAVRRLKDEYLIRITDDNKLEALHPIRAQIVYDALCNQTCITAVDIVCKTLSCVSSKSVRLILMDYFSQYKYVLAEVQQLAKIYFADWVGYANAIKAMLWLDTKRYVDNNMNFIQSFVERHGKAWLCFLPRDLSGIECQNELLADSMRDISVFNKVEVQKIIDETKSSLISLSIDYAATDCFIRNCIYPDSLPDSDEERASFGYALFWMAKRNLEISLSFSLTEIIKSVCTGEIQSCADAIRGLFEHSALLDSYQNAVGEMVKRLIPEMRILSFTVTDNEVDCKFVPLFLTEGTDSENRNENQYWRIKMLNILQQIYPEKEYINIELIGVDLLTDLGIKAMDDKLHIHKSNRYNSWTTEVNGWVKNRIDYIFRPVSWNQYVSEIDEMRRNVNELILETIKLNDDIYKRGHFTKDRWKRIEERIKIFRTHIFSENRLPYFAVDPYCLYSEGSSKQPTIEYYPMQQLLSVGKYEKFRKLLNKVYNSINNFFNQFAEVLLVRINKQDMNAVNNPRLAMFNLFSAAKDMINFQRNYTFLFSRYSSFDEAYNQEELENILILVNVWRYVIDNQPKGYAIAYDAKREYRKGIGYFDASLAEMMTKVKSKIVRSEQYVYLINDFDISSENTLESGYLNAVLQIRNAFSGAISLSSNRWYVETQPLKFVYVPFILGAYASIAFMIPFYKIFDTDESHIMESMFPCKIEEELAERIISGKAQKNWIEAMQRVGEIKTYLQCYSQVLEVSMDDECIEGVNAFKSALSKRIEFLQKELVSCEILVGKLMNEAVGQVAEFLERIKLFFALFDNINDCIEHGSDPSEMIQEVETVFAVMLFLQPYVIEHDSE